MDVRELALKDKRKVQHQRVERADGRQKPGVTAAKNKPFISTIINLLEERTTFYVVLAQRHDGTGGPRFTMSSYSVS